MKRRRKLLDDLEKEGCRQRKLKTYNCEGETSLNSNTSKNNVKYKYIHWKFFRNLICTVIHKNIRQLNWTKGYPGLTSFLSMFGEIFPDKSST
jgi:hypothetical protein